MTQGVRAGHTELRKAQRRFKKGYWLKSSGSNHMVVMGPEGPVRRNDGSGRHLGLPSSPRPSSLEYHIRRLKDHGVLDEQDEIRSSRTTEKLVRDDVKESEPEENNLRTHQLRVDLADVKVTKPNDLRGYAELVDILAHVSAVEPWQANDAVTKLYGGMTLTEKDREPFINLLAILEEEEDPIKARFRLLRQARGLPIQDEPAAEEEQQLQEEKLETPDTMRQLASMGKGTVEQIVGTFISDLRDQVTLKLEEINQIEDLIGTLEEQYPSIVVEAEAEEGVESGGNGGVSRTLRVAPEPEKKTETRSSSGHKGSRLNPDDVQKMVDQGGEWTLKELAEGLGFAEPTISRAVQGLVESGDMVVVTPSKMGYGGRQPGTYGSTKFFAK